MSPFIKEGEYTSSIYTMIKEGSFSDAIRLLRYELHRNANSRAALSLLGFCYFQTQEYIQAAECYEHLTELFPSNNDYRLNQAQSHYNAFMFTEALNDIAQINDPEVEKRVMKLEAAIKYREEDFRNARILVEQFDKDDPDTEVNIACLEFKEKKYTEALSRFTEATRHQVPYVSGAGLNQNDLTYAIALCHYQLEDYASATKMIAEIVDRAIKDYPELGVGTASDALEGRSVGNTQALNESLIVEACNLKFAIEYKSKNAQAAAEVLSHMPPRREEELDPVTLHNQALIGIDTNVADSFAKLQYLLGQNPFPPETFANLLLLYCKYEYYDLTADVLAENAHLTYKYLDEYTFDYLDSMIQTSETEQLSKLDKLAEKHLVLVRRKHQLLMEVRGESPSSKTLHRAIGEFERAIERFLPVLMAQAKIRWDKADYGGIEKLFKRSAEFCDDIDVWKMNLAHTLFMQDNYKDACDCYTPLVQKSFKKILDVSAIVLANMCACYVMTGNNEEAQELIQEVEREEQMRGVEEKSFHSPIINLVIGTLYCAKGNYEFGIKRIVHALEPCERKLGIDTWFYAKRCLISMLENIAKCSIFISDDILEQCLHFLTLCEVHGHEISTESNVFIQQSRVPGLQKTVEKEARELRALLLRIME